MIDRRPESPEELEKEHLKSKILEVFKAKTNNGPFDILIHGFYFQIFLKYSKS